MAINKYISTKEAARLTGLSTQEIYNLIHSGALPARKAPKSGWRICAYVTKEINKKRGANITVGSSYYLKKQINQPYTLTNAQRIAANNGH